MLTILDEHTRECHVLRPERALRAADVLVWLERAIKEHGAPAFLRSDNGSEFIAKEVQRWLADNEIKTIAVGMEATTGLGTSLHSNLQRSTKARYGVWITQSIRWVGV